MEVFLCLQLSSTEKLLIVPLEDPERGAHREGESLCALRFNTSEARCFSAVDREHLLAIIESTFGSCAAFNMHLCEHIRKCNSMLLPAPDEPEYR